MTYKSSARWLNTVTVYLMASPTFLVYKHRRRYRRPDNIWILMAAEFRLADFEEGSAMESPQCHLRRRHRDFASSSEKQWNESIWWQGSPWRWDECHHASRFCMFNEETRAASRRSRFHCRYILLAIIFRASAKFRREDLKHAVPEGAANEMHLSE